MATYTVIRSDGTEEKFTNQRKAWKHFRQLQKMGIAQAFVYDEIAKTYKAKS